MFPGLGNLSVAVDVDGTHTKRRTGGPAGGGGASIEGGGGGVGRIGGVDRCRGRMGDRGVNRGEVGKFC